MLAVPVVLLLLAPPAARAADRMQVPGGAHALSRLVGHVEPGAEDFAASLNRVLLRRIVDDHEQWRQVPERLLLSGYLETVRDLRRSFPVRLELRLDGEGLPAEFLELARFFGFEDRDGEWVERRGSAAGADRDLLGRVAAALDVDIPSMADRLRDGETVPFDIPSSVVDAPLPFADWSELSGAEVTAQNALTRLIEDQRLGLVLEGLRRADRRLPELLGADGLRTAYRECSLPFYRYASSIELRDGALVVPGGVGAPAVWRRLIGASPDAPGRFILALLREADARAAHLWNAMFFADRATAGFVLDDSRRSAAFRGPLLDYIDRIAAAEDAGRLPAARGGDYSVATLARSLALDDGDAAQRVAAGAEPWIEQRGLQQACLEEARLRKIVRRLKARGVTGDRFLEHLLGDQTPLHGSLGLLFQPFVEIVRLFEPAPALLTPGNVLLLRRSAAYRPLLLETLGPLTFEGPDDLTDYLRTAEGLDCLEATPERDTLVLAFQGGVELLAALARESQVTPAAAARGLRAWCDIHRDATLDSDLFALQWRWLAATLDELDDPGRDAPGRGTAERRLLAALAGGTATVTFEAHGLRHSGRRGGDLAAGMAAFLRSQSIASPDLLAALAERLERIERGARDADDMQVRLSVLQTLSLIETLDVPAAARLPGLEHPQFADSVRHRLDVREFIATTWRGRDHVPPADVVETLAMLRRLLGREFEGLLCAIPYLRPIAILDDPHFDQPLLVLRHAVARTVDPQSARLEVFPSAWSETALVPAAFSPAGTHVAGSLTHVGRVLVQHHALRLAPDRPAHTWIDVRTWVSTALESDWQRLSPATLRLAAAAIDAGEKLMRAAVREDDGWPPDLRAALERIVPRRRFQDAAARGRTLPLSAPGEHLLAGLMLLERDDVPAGLADARRRVGDAAARVGPGWRAALQPLGAPTPRLNGRPRPWVGPWPAYEALEREASVAALRERQFLDVSLAVIRYAAARDLPAPVGFDVLLRVLERLPEDLLLESERDWESFVRFITTLDEAYLDGRLRECLIRGLYTVEQL